MSKVKPGADQEVTDTARANRSSGGNARTEGPQAPRDEEYETSVYPPSQWSGTPGGRLRLSRLEHCKLHAENFSFGAHCVKRLRVFAAG